MTQCTHTGLELQSQPFVFFFYPDECHHPSRRVDRSAVAWPKSVDVSEFMSSWSFSYKRQQTESVVLITHLVSSLTSLKRLTRLSPLVPHLSPSTVRWMTENLHRQFYFIVGILIKQVLGWDPKETEHDSYSDVYQLYSTCRIFTSGVLSSLD